MILLDKVIIQNVPFYKLHSIDNFKEELLKYGYTDDMNVCFYNMYNDDTKTNIPVLCLEKTTSEPDFDYDWDENLEYIGENVMTTLIPFSFSMFNGKKIKFEIADEIDIDNDEITKLIKEYNNYSLRISKKIKKKDYENMIKIRKVLIDKFPDFSYIIRNCHKNKQIFNLDEDIVRIDDIILQEI
jgi:hypothetical protein